MWTAEATATLPALRELGRSEWAAFEPPGALHQAIGYRSIVADLRPVERHTAQSPAHWLRKLLAGPCASSV